MSGKYYTNPSVQFHWTTSRNNSESPLTAVVAGDPSIDQPVYGVRIIELLERAFDGKTSEELRDYLVENHRFTRADAEQEVEELIESKLLLENRQQVDSKRTWFEHDWDRSLYYHLSTRDESVAEERVGDERTATTSNDEEEVIDLPTPTKIPDESLDQVLLDRRTCRDFDGSSIDGANISSILYHGLAPGRKAVQDDESSVSEGLSSLRVSSFPIAVYPVVARSPDVDSGVYQYELDNHSLRRLGNAEYTATEIDDLLQRVVVNQPFIKGAPVTLILSVDLRKYRRICPRSVGLRHLLTVVSAHAHRLLLTANAFGFDVFQCAALKDSLADQVVGADGFDEAVVYTLTIGRETVEEK